MDRLHFYIPGWEMPKMKVEFFATALGWILDACFGGYKQSGNGREWGEAGLDEFLELKAIFGMQNLQDEYPAISVG